MTNEKYIYNSVAINVEKSNISIIDVDKPEECFILEHLKKYCLFYVKTKKGFHFYFKKSDESEALGKNQQCDIIDINTNLLYFSP